MRINEVGISVVWPVMLFLAGTMACHSQTDAESRAASVVANKFETVVYTKSEFLPPSVDPDPAAVDSKDELALPFSEMIVALRTLGPNTESDVKSAYASFLVGAADFAGPAGLRPGPDGLGMVNSRKCYIAVLGNGGEPNLERDFKGASIETVAGRQAWAWTVPQFEGSTNTIKFYAIQIPGSYLVLANSQVDLERIVNALTISGESALTPLNVPAWDTFTGHGYWAYRQFRRAGVRSLDAAGLTGLGSDATAIAFFADVEQRVSFVQVFSSNTGVGTAPPLLKKIGPERFQPLNESIWQSEIPLSKNEASVDAMFEIFYRLGFGVAL